MASSEAAPPRAALLGVWRLVDIQLTSGTPRQPDPFFAAGSTGLIVYDPSGWMSVQISGPRRAAWAIPETRTQAHPRDLRLKAAAYDSYYAYFGTWDYDARSGVMTHHVKSSLLPAEVGLDYAQRIRMDGNCMAFIGELRTKVWQRIGTR